MDYFETGSIENIHHVMFHSVIELFNCSDLERLN